MKNKRKIPVFRTILGLVILVFILMVLTGKRTWFSDAPPLQIIPDMDNQSKVEPQEETKFFSDGSNLRMPVDHTFPRNVKTYKTDKADIETAERLNVNTSVPNNPYVLARGQNRFNVMCSPCHGLSAKGDGMVAQRGFPPPPNLLRPETIALSDARIFHIISAGQNVMPSYADKLIDEDRWAVVQYIRHLQGVEGGGIKEIPQQTQPSNSTPQPTALRNSKKNSHNISQVQ